MTERFMPHKGPVSEPRVLAQACSSRPLKLQFQPGKPVLQSIADALAAEKIDSAVIEIGPVDFASLVYVIPALSGNPERPAWYSDTRQADGGGKAEELVMSFGQRQGEPFIHCHGIWQHRDGFRAAGHLIPHEAEFGEEVEALVHAISGAILDQQPDAETSFPLLTPVAHGQAVEGEARSVLLRIKPNTDIHAAIETAARTNGISNADIHGIGSLVGCDFTDGRYMESHASELFVRKGSIQDGEAVLDIGIADIDGGIFEGEVKRGENPVCVTCELLIVER